MAELFSSTPYAALTARERIWAAIREMKTVTVREVADRCDAKADAVRGYFTGLVAAGVLDVIHRGSKTKPSVSKHVFFIQYEFVEQGYRTK